MAVRPRILGCPHRQLSNSTRSTAKIQQKSSLAELLAGYGSALPLLLSCDASLLSLFRSNGLLMYRSVDYFGCLETSLQVMAAEIQGFEANAEHYLVVKARSRSRSAWQAHQLKRKIGSKYHDLFTLIFWWYVNECWTCAKRIAWLQMSKIGTSSELLMVDSFQASRKEKGRDTLGCPTFLRPLPRQVSLRWSDDTR